MTRGLPGAALAVLLWTGGAAAAPAGAPAGTLEAYREPVAPPPLILEDMRGRDHRLEHYRGQVVLVNFWASWCAPCIWELPGMGRLSQALENRPFTLLAVDVGESKSTVFRFVARLGGTPFPVLLDRDSGTFTAWGVETLPTSFLLDPDGQVRYRAVGAREWDDPEILSIIESLMEEGRSAPDGLLPGSLPTADRPDTPPLRTRR